MRNDETKDVLRQFDRDIMIYHDAIKLLDYFDFDKLLLEFDTRYKALTLERPRPSQAKCFNIAYQLLSRKIVSKCVSKYDCVYIFKDKWIKLSDYDITNDILKLLCHIVSQYIDAEKFNKLSNMLQSDMVDLNSNGIIQFNDCYIDNNKIYEGQYRKSLPDFMLDYSVYDIIDSELEVDAPKEFQELCMHLCQNDETTYNRFIDDLSMCLSNDQKFNQTNGKMLRLYGPTAENGKSTLLNHLEGVFTRQNMMSFNVASLRGYDLEMVTRHLIAFDPEEQDNYWNDEITRNIKTIITSEMINVRQIYSKPIKMIPITTLISATNTMAKSNDKSNGLSRRLDWFYVKEKLEKDNQWFINLKSDESIHQTMRYLFYNFINLIRRGSLSPTSDQMEDTKLLFNESNNSALAFINSTDLNDIKNRTVNYVWELYTNYCIDEDYNQLG